MQSFIQAKNQVQLKFLEFHIQTGIFRSCKINLLQLRINYIISIMMHSMIPIEMMLPELLRPFHICENISQHR